MMGVCIVSEITKIFNFGLCCYPVNDVTTVWFGILINWDWWLRRGTSIKTKSWLLLLLNVARYPALVMRRENKWCVWVLHRLSIASCYHGFNGERDSGVGFESTCDHCMLVFLYRECKVLEAVCTFFLWTVQQCSREWLLTAGNLS